MVIHVTGERASRVAYPLVTATERNGNHADRCGIRVDHDVTTVATAREHLRTPKRLQEWKQRTRRI